MALDASKMRVYEVSMVDDVAPVLTLFILGSRKSGEVASERQ